MLIGGLQKFSLIDYPGKISAVVFLSGCNFHCGFCHNPELVLPELIKNQKPISEKDFFEFLKSRAGKLDGVCVTGGEPTVWQELPEFIGKIKILGFLVKLDTNASNPRMIEKIVDGKLVDYFAVDIKNFPEKYEKTIKAKVKIKDIEETLKMIVSRDIYLELRTTVVPRLITKEDFVRIKKWLEKLGVLPEVSLYTIQQFRPLKTLDKKFEKIKPYSEEELREIEKVFLGKVKTGIKGI